MRQGRVSRITNETQIELSLKLGSKGPIESPEIRVSTGYGFADHMLTLMAFWGGFELSLTCKGDMYIDAHHTLEDCAICLGQAFFDALGDRKGINRVGFGRVPMDEALAEITLDFSGRPYLVYQGGDLLPPMIGGEESDVWREFFRAFSAGARMNLHIEYRYGLNGHHLLESACKGFGLALKEAVEINGSSVFSTKGSLD